MIQNPNYNLNDDIDLYSKYTKNGDMINIDIDFSNKKETTNGFELDLSKYKNNKPVRKIIRGSIVNEQ